MKDYVIYGAAFVVGFFIGVALVGCAPAKAQEPMQAIQGQYGALCPMDAENYLTTHNYKEVNKWVGSDGKHLWVMYQNEKKWLLVMKNAMTQMTCFFDQGDLEEQES
jgi:hypothetical protein